jgi:hypothetical protein
MATKTNKKAGMNIGKISFGKRREGVAKKNWGPKEERPKKYRGQGR